MLIIFKEVEWNSLLSKCRMHIVTSSERNIKKFYGGESWQTPSQPGDQDLQ